MQKLENEISSWKVRPGSKGDLPFLQDMLYMAAFWRTDQVPPLTLEEMLVHFEISRYIRDWGRPGDTALIAEDTNARPIGAAWFRLFSAGEPGYGFIEASIPEVTIAIVPEWRRKGVGQGLLTTLLETARVLGFTALSLSVSRENPAVRLYERCGFKQVGRLEGSWTMCLDLVDK